MISVIVPVYNVEKYLHRCIGSIRNQTYNNLEIILVDDGSSDNSGKICDEYSNIDTRIKTRHTLNNGLVMARKTGLDMVKGEYTAFVDADDWIEEDMYEKLLSKAMETDADFVHSHYYREDEKENILWEAEYDGKMFYGEEYDKEILLEECVFGHKKIEQSLCTKLYKTDFIKECYNNVPNYQNYGEDLLCLCESILNSKKIAIFSKAFYHYVIRQGSITDNITEETIAWWGTLYLCMIKVFERYECSQKITELAKMRLVNLEIEHLKRLKKYHIDVHLYYFDDIDLIKDKRIVLYGAGNVGKDYYAQFSKYQNCKIVGWVDEQYNNYQFDYYRVKSPVIIRKLEFDYIIVAVKDREKYCEIEKWLKEEGILSNKILWKTPEK